MLSTALNDGLEIILSLCSFFGRSGRAPKPLDSLVYAPSPHLLVFVLKILTKPARFLSGKYRKHSWVGSIR